MATQDVCDLIGMPIELNGKSTNAKPTWIVDEKSEKTAEIDPDKNTVYFLDEFNRGNRHVLAAMLPFLLSGTIHEHSIRPGDAVLAACNFADDDFDVQELVDKALIDRAGHFIVNPTNMEFKDYVKNKVDMTTLGLMSTNSSMFDIKTKTLEENAQFKVTPSRRKIERIMKHFCDVDRNWVKSHGIHILNAYLGSEFASVWMAAFKDSNNKLSSEEIFERTKATEEKINSFVSGDEVRVDIIHQANDECIATIKRAGRKLPTAHYDNYIKYIFDLPGDLLRQHLETITEELEEINGIDLSETIHSKAYELGRKDVIKTILKSYNLETGE